MKVLQVNKYYLPRSGAERSLFNISGLLEENGHQVIPFSMRHDGNPETPYSEYFVDHMDYQNVKGPIEKMRVGLKVIYSREAHRKLLHLIDKEQPDIAHIHKFNTNLTPSILYALKKRDIPVVHTMRDYRAVCPNYNLYDFKRGKVCEDCRGHRYHRAVARRCFSSLPVCMNIAMESYLYHFLRTYETKIDRFVAPSAFLKDKVAEFGLPRNRIVHVPNFIDTSQYEPLHSDSGYILYFGRIEEHKGVKTLVESMDGIDRNLYLAGDGEYRRELEEETKGNDNIRFLGFRTGEDLKELIRNSLFTVIPSEWYENCPNSVLESFAMGKPVVGSDMGGIPELVEDGRSGLIFRAGNREDLREKLHILADDPNLVMEMGKMARTDVEEKYSPEGHYRAIMKVYGSVM